jgi:hypothetical protein
MNAIKVYVSIETIFRVGTDGNGSMDSNGYS